MGQQYGQHARQILISAKKMGIDGSRFSDIAALESLGVDGHNRFVQESKNMVCRPTPEFHSNFEWLPSWLSMWIV